MQIQTREDFIKKIELLNCDYLLALICWSHAGGSKDHILFKTVDDLRVFVDSAPESTRVLVFPGITPKVVFRPATVDELRSIIYKCEKDLEEQQEWLLVEVKDPTMKEKGAIPYNIRAVSSIEDYAKPPSEEDLRIFGEESLINSTLAFYPMAPYWDSDVVFYEWIVGNKPGAY